MQTRVIPDVFYQIFKALDLVYLLVYRNLQEIVVSCIQTSQQTCNKDKWLTSIEQRNLNVRRAIVHLSTIALTNFSKTASPYSMNLHDPLPCMTLYKKINKGFWFNNNKMVELMFCLKKKFSETTRTNKMKLGSCLA